MHCIVIWLYAIVVCIQLVVWLKTHCYSISKSACIVVYVQIVGCHSLAHIVIEFWACLILCQNTLLLNCRHFVILCYRSVSWLKLTKWIWFYHYSFNRCSSLGPGSSSVSVNNDENWPTEAWRKHKISEKVSLGIYEYMLYEHIWI